MTAAGVAAVLIVVVLAVALYVGGVFSSSARSSLVAAEQTTSPPVSASAPTTASSTLPTAAPAAASSAVPSPSTTPSSAATTASGAPALTGPAGTLRQHFQDLGSGQYRAAFALTSDQYQSQNPSWVSDRATADPVIDVISLNTQHDSSGGAQISVDFYAHDRNPSSGSDTQCREFQGTANMIRTGGTWRYDPAGNALKATVVPASDPHCLG